MSSQKLVGKSYGRSFSLRLVVFWAEESSKAHIGYVPKVMDLTRNWFAFNFLQENHA